jgi:hypothetical protein
VSHLAIRGIHEKTMSADGQLPKWAPPVPQRLIRRLYQTDAEGIYDDELIDEVGYRLLARCESFIAANRARAGEVACPRCAETVRREELLRCQCGWELPWSDYFKTIQHRQLSGAEPVLSLFRDFVRSFPSARTPREKVLLIDRLIHGFHWHQNREVWTRPVAVNLIEGRMGPVVAFLDELTYGENSTPGTREKFVEWDEKIEANRAWYPSRRNAKTEKTPEPDR